MLPFRRIAIFSPALFLGRPWQEMSVYEFEGAVRSWALNSIAKGADAWYLRWQDHKGVGKLLNALSDLGNDIDSPPITRLIPFQASEFSCQHDAIHYTGRDNWSVPVVRVAYRGCSCHNESDLERAVQEGMDYVFYSPIFPTRTHPKAKPLGLEHLAEICEAYPLKVFALGGISEDQEKACLDAGAYGIAGIRMFL